jgi:hypothetical protein
MTKQLLFIALFITAITFAQSPQKMSYQAVLRSSSSALITSAPVGMKISVLQGSATGTVAYSETQSPTTNANGLISLEIGSGTPVTGTFAGINWANGPYFIKTETDPSGGTTYTITGTSPLMSVPYALFSASGTAGSTGPAGKDGVDGADGPQGPQGPSGAAGIQGLKGDTGAASTVAGPTGPQGAIGLTGATGANGASGETGTAGTNGADGSNGTPGADGLTGPQGPSGAAGIQGLKGDIGLTGDTGATSTVAGPTGPQGAIGLTGATGATGLTGATGAAGTNGTNGVDGATGLTGATGTNGADGLTTSVNGVTQIAGAITLTKSNIGLGSVDNTTDLLKPVSTATQSALDLKAPLASPTFTGTVSGIDKTMVGLGSVDNTTDLLKPVSTATQSALDLKAPLASPTFTGTVSGIDKTMVGLGSVDNTTDLLKPVSTATQSALDLKAPLASPTFTGTPTLPTGTIAVTQTAGNNTTAIATTAFVLANADGNVSGFTHYLGEVFNGGIIYYLYRGSDGLEHGLIVALTESTAAWQTRGTLVNADRTEDGAYNTTLMTGSPAATYIVGLGAGWYLPSIDELGLLYYNRYSAQKGLRTGGNTLLSSTAYYWSSTEFTAFNEYAYYFYFSSGVVYSNFKTNTYSVRGVRAF